MMEQELGRLRTWAQSLREKREIPPDRHDSLYLCIGWEGRIWKTVEKLYRQQDPEIRRELDDFLRLYGRTLLAYRAEGLPVQKPELYLLRNCPGFLQYMTALETGAGTEACCRELRDWLLYLRPLREDQDIRFLMHPLFRELLEQTREGSPERMFLLEEYVHIYKSPGMKMYYLQELLAAGWQEEAEEYALELETDEAELRGESERDPENRLRTALPLMRMFYLRCLARKTPERILPLLEKAADWLQENCLTFFPQIQTQLKSEAGFEVNLDDLFGLYFITGQPEAGFRRSLQFGALLVQSVPAADEGLREKAGVYLKQLQCIRFFFKYLSDPSAEPPKDAAGTITARPGSFPELAEMLTAQVRKGGPADPEEYRALARLRMDMCYEGYPSEKDLRLR